MVAEDEKIEAHNRRIQNAQETLRKSEQNVGQRKVLLAAVDAKLDPDQHQKLSEAFAKASSTLEKSQASYKKVIASGVSLVQTGSGRVSLLVTPSPSSSTGSEQGLHGS